MADGSVLFLFIVGIIIIIIISASRRSSARHIQRANNLEQRGEYLDALDLYTRYSSLDVAAEMILRTPEVSQILALRALEKRYSPSKIEKAFIRLARSFITRNDPHAAANAFVLAKKPFAGAKVYIDHGGIDYVPAAIQILDQNSSLILHRDNAIRNLARYAYNNQKFMETAELLRTIGAEEEANTVLIAAASDLKKHGNEKVAKQYLSTIGRPKIALEHYVKEIKDNFQQGNIENTRRSLAVAKNIIAAQKGDEENFTTVRNEIAEYDRLLKILDSARDLLRKKNTNQAIALYGELLDSLGDHVPAAIFAEAALANEEKNPQYAANLYNQAAQNVKSSQAANSFRIRAQKLGITTGEEMINVNKTSIEATDEVEEYCSVCRMTVSESSLLVRCPECGTPAHYSHLAEWLKIRGVCPICKKKVKVSRPE